MPAKRLLAVVLALLAEAALLSLADWQWHRYHQRLAEAAARAAAPQTTVTGQPTAFAWLTNQPNPSGAEGAGRRLITILQTGQGPLVADLGWQPNPPNPAEAPVFTAYQLPQLTVTGLTQPLPIRHGWLKGPLTTTNPHLLAFLAPSALTSQTVPPDYLAATQTSPTLPHLASQPPALASPTMHLSYAAQWLAMALLFPLLCWNLWRKRR